MSYVSIGAVFERRATGGVFERRAASRSIGPFSSNQALLASGGGFPAEIIEAYKLLQPFKLIAMANRKFVSALIVQWIKDDRGISGFPGYEKGRANGGGYNTFIELLGERINLQYVYNILRKASHQTNPKYDDLRAAALAVIVVRDPLHTLNSAIKVKSKGLGDAAEQAAQEAASDPNKVDWQALATQGATILEKVKGVLQLLLSDMSKVQQTYTPSGRGSGEGSGEGSGAASATAGGFPVLPAAIAVGLAAFILSKR